MAAMWTRSFASLSDLAETILVQIAQTQEPVIHKRFGEAYLADARLADWMLQGLGPIPVAPSGENNR